MRFSTLIAFMLPLSALGAPACFDCVHPQSETDIAVKVFTDGLRQTNLGLFNMVPSAMSVSDNMVKAIQGVERILNQAIPRAPTSLPSEQDLRSFTSGIFHTQCATKDLDATIRREDQSSISVDSLLRSMPGVFDGLELAIDGLENFASIYDKSLDLLFTSAGEAIPTKC